MKMKTYAEGYMLIDGVMEELPKDQIDLMEKRSRALALSMQQTKLDQDIGIKK